MRIFYRMGCVTTGFCSSVAINSVVLPLIKVENEYGWLLLLLLLRAVDVSNTSEMCIRVSLYPVLENLICIEKKNGLKYHISPATIFKDFLLFACLFN